MGLGEAFAPLHERRFRLLWLGRVSSAAGDALMPLALAFAVLSIDHSATALGSVLAAFWIARVGCTLVGGVIADRLPRRLVMLACDGVRACIQVFVATMLLTHQMTLPLFFATAAFFGAASAFFGPASDGLVQQTIGRGDLQQANALLGISQNTMNVFGPALAGVLIALSAPGVVFAIDGVSFLASAFFLLRLQIAPQARGTRSHFLRELREGFDEVRTRPWVRAPIVGFAISNFCFASFIVLGPVIAREHLGGARSWGVVSTAGALGAILGSVASVRVHPSKPLSFCFGVTMLLALPIATLARPLPTYAIALGWFVGMGAIAIGNTFWETTLQRRIPQQVFARVRSYDILVSFVFMPIGFLAFPLLAQALGDEETLLLAAGVCAVTNLTLAFAPSVRGVRVEQADASVVLAPARAA